MDILKINDNYAINKKGEIFRIKYNDKANKKKYEKKLPLKLKFSTDKDGYKRVSLSFDGKPKIFYVHRLVATQYLEHEEFKNQVNHIDGNKSNNNVENLEWVTQSENRKHCLKYLKPNLKNNKLSKKVVQLDMNNNVIKIYPSAKQAARENNFSQGHISEVCRGEKKTHKGFKWEYYK